MKRLFERTDTDLEIEEHLGAHARGFVVQKVGVTMIIVVVLLAAAGLFGDGPLSTQRQSSQSASVEYERFYRHEAKMDLKVELVASKDTNIVSFPRQYLQHFEIASISPSATSSALRGENSEFGFNGHGHGTITFYLIPKKVGSINGTLSVNGVSFDVNHFIYP